jgi:glycosyltransferase involved in cell wall biosynthesis
MRLSSFSWRTYDPCCGPFCKSAAINSKVLEGFQAAFRAAKAKGCAVTDDCASAPVGGSAQEIIDWKLRQTSANVHWHGRLPPARVHAFLNVCDLLLAPYQHGPKTASGRDTSRWMSPLKIFEYMASGVPMVVSDFPVLREVLDGDMAMLVPVEDIDAWRQAICRLAESAEYRGKMGQSAFIAYQAHYTWSARARRVLEGF